MSDVEARLRQFRPRRPEALPEPIRPRRSWWPIWIGVPGVAAVVVAIVFSQAVAPPAPRSEAPEVAVTLGALNAIGLTDAADLDRALASSARATLPDVERPGGILQALSEE